MNNLFLGAAIRTWFNLTSRNQASAKIQKLNDGYLELASQTNTASGTLAVHVPKMLGIDEDMRDWSFYKILEHNVIVNQSITSIIESLVHGDEPKGAGAIDMKKDVMPSKNPGKEQIEFFHKSVTEYLRTVSNFQNLRNSSIKHHPLFGAFTAHQWHCMFGFHLFLHYKQAKYIVNKITNK